MHTHQIPVDSAPIYVEDTGGPGPAVMLLHGGFVSGREWRPQREAWDARWRLLVPDLRGHGRSARTPGVYSVERWSADMLMACARLGIERLVCVGHSLGGMVAQVMARRAPGLVAGVVLADTSYATRATLWDRAQVALAQVSLRLLSVKHIADASARQLGGRRRDVGPFVRQEMMRFADDRAHYLDLWGAVFDFDSRPWLDQVRCPALILVADDNNPTRGQAPRLCAGLGGPAHVRVIPRAGHMLHWDNPIDFNQAVEEFVDRVW